MNQAGSEANDDFDPMGRGFLPERGDELAGGSMPAEASEPIAKRAAEPSSADIDPNETGDEQPTGQLLATGFPETASDPDDAPHGNGAATEIGGPLADAGKTSTLAAPEEKTDADSPVAQVAVEGNGAAPFLNHS